MRSLENEQEIRLTPGCIVRVPKRADDVKSVKGASQGRREDALPFLYWCAHCNLLARSKESEPLRCTKCGSPYWRGDFVQDVRHGRRQPRPVHVDG